MTEQQSLPDVRVPLVAEDAAGGETAELYQRIRDATGLPFVPDVFLLISTRPEFLKAVLAGVTAVFDGGELTRDTKELIAAWTSRVNSCPYCVNTHSMFLRLAGGSEELTAAVQTAASADQLPVSEPTKVLLRLVTKVSEAAYQVSDEDWRQPADAGWSNAELLEAVFCAAIFNFVTRLVNSLGLGALATDSHV